MGSYLNSLSSHYTNLKRLIPTSLSPESDLSVSDPNDSHVSRVLRAYYTETGRPFPPWLGPDPNAPQKAVVAPAYVSAPNTPGLPPRRGAGGLGDLFGEPNDQGRGGAPNEPLSLRTRRPGARGGTSQGSSTDSAPYSGHHNPPPRQPSPQDLGRRPLPSHQLASYQSRATGSSSSSLAPSESTASLARAPSAHDRLKAKFGGGGARSGGSY